MMEGALQTIRRPRCRLVVSGSEISGCRSVELSSSNFGQAGSFFVQVAMSTPQMASDVTWFAADTLDVSIQMGLLPQGASEGSLAWQEMMSGRVDRVKLDPVTGTITLDGRDYAARLLDLPVTQGFLNCTSSEVAQQLASSCGLSAIVDQTTSMVGQYYQIEHARLTLSRFSRFSTAWDLLCSLAQLEGFDLWVQGTTLYFQATASVDTITHQISFVAANQAGGSPSLNVSSLTFERSLAVKGGLPVAVSSWNSRQRRRISARAGDGEESSSGQINVVRPNLLPDTAQSLANGIFGQIAGHQQTFTATMPGELGMASRDRVRLTGVGAGWDGDYCIDSLDREMTLEGGFVQRFTAKTLKARG